MEGLVKRHKVGPGGLLYSSVISGSKIRLEESALDNVTIIRIVAGVLAVAVFVVLVFRMKKKASR